MLDRLHKEFLSGSLYRQVAKFFDSFVSSEKSWINF